jgi:hypothetical protein
MAHAPPVSIRLGFLLLVAGRLSLPKLRPGRALFIVHQRIPIFLPVAIVIKKLCLRLPVLLTTTANILVFIRAAQRPNYTRAESLRLTTEPSPPKILVANQTAVAGNPPTAAALSLLSGICN